KSTRHSFKAMVRLLMYLHQPRRHRVAPQLLLRYDRNWSGANPVGILMPAKDAAPAFTTDVTITGPAVRPVLSATLPVLFTVQRGKRVLQQLGFGPALRWAAVGDPGRWNPFAAGQTFRAETWLYWYPTGTEGLDLQKTNVRIGLSPYLDVHVRRSRSQPLTAFGALVEIKVGVRGYEY
ncbi:MAG: hypothetical protein U0168_28255, partial [Nannocystaceae bacterium]